MKNTKIITVSLAAALAIGAITANGVLVSADAEKGTIKVAASATPHAEILEEAKPTLNEKLTSTFSLFCSTLGTGGGS